MANLVAWSMADTQNMGNDLVQAERERVQHVHDALRVLLACGVSWT